MREPWFIESHSASEITLDDIAKIGGVSRYHMTRAFGTVTGHSIMRYVRRRRALNKMEMLAWDVWGAMPRPGETLCDNQLAFFDRLAEFTREPDAWFDELRRLYETDDRLRVPGTVFNALLNRPETL